MHNIINIIISIIIIIKINLMVIIVIILICRGAEQHSVGRVQRTCLAGGT